ncbi:MAG: putative RNA-binding protein YlqC (UPF0109 family) [Bradymonadia bacterium]|jgi:predicted RNA-binding protein YlqC (UPF0109 family)
MANPVKLTEKQALYTSLVSDLVSPMVAHPDDVEVTCGNPLGGIEILVAPNESDVGRLIGKGGATIAALRRVVEFAARRNGDVVALEIEAD